MKIFTIESGSVVAGATVKPYVLTNGAEIPTVQVGEKGRGRKLAFVPVQLTGESQKIFDEKGSVRLSHCEIGATRAGAPKLIEKTGNDCDSDAECLCVFRTHFGYRGGNSHTGDRMKEYWKICHSPYRLPEGVIVDYTKKMTSEEADEINRLFSPLIYGENHSIVNCCERVLEFLPFPGRIIAQGSKADGIAGNVGGGDQLIAVMPKDTVFRTSYSGRLYGNPAAHYYHFDGVKIDALTWEERRATELF